MDGIFLHTSWRSSGTWIWQRLREEPGNMGFYEPLHEALGGMKLSELRSLSPASWRSRHHAAPRPYFAEYEPLLQPQGGVKLAGPKLAFRRFFTGAGEPHPTLHAYITQLGGLAKTAGKLPVFKCTRSQGRMAWFRENFPNAQHVALIRQPWTQFRSAWRCAATDGNRYFLAAPFLVLESNLAHQQVAALAKAFGLPLGWGTHLPLALRLKAWKLAVRGLDAGTLYQAHLSLWLLNSRQALAADMVLDGDSSPAALAAAFGLAAGRTARPAFEAPPYWPQLGPGWLQATHARALRALTQPEDPRLMSWLQRAEADSARDLTGKTLPAATPARF